MLINSPEIGSDSGEGITAAARLRKESLKLIVRGACLDEAQKIMVRAPNWIGDAVMALPALEALRARFPEAELVVVSKPWVSELYGQHPAVSRQIVYDREGQHCYICSNAIARLKQGGRSTYFCRGCQRR